MAAELPYMPFYPADHLRDTRILSLTARGAWMDLVCVMWHPRLRGALSMKVGALARLLGTSVEETELILAEFLDAGVADIARDGLNVTITSRRVSREWRRATAFRSERAEAGRRGAKKRWENHHAQPALPANAPPPQVTAEPQPEKEDLDTTPWHGLSGDEAMALLGRHFPDRDIWGEYQRFKQVRAEQGRKPDWRGLIGWLRKAAPVADLGRKKPQGRSTADPDGWPAWLAGTYPKADPATRFADAPDDVRREFLAGGRG